MDERFDIDVGYHDPVDRRDDFPEDKPSPAEYEDDTGHTERCGFTELGMGQREWSCAPDCPVRREDCHHQ